MPVFCSGTRKRFVRTESLTASATTKANVGSRGLRTNSGGARHRRTRDRRGPGAEQSCKNRDSLPRALLNSFTFC